LELQIATPTLSDLGVEKTQSHRSAGYRRSAAENPKRRERARSGKELQLATLSDLGVEKKQSHRWQTIAGVPPKSACAQNGKPGKS
jgi:hypothetical protein